MAKWVGQPLERVEDARLLTGRGVFVADLTLKDAYAAAILRSPHAHARIRSIDTSAAKGAQGVAGVITGADALAHTQPFAVGVDAPVRYYCIATDKVRFVGEPVAVVVARDRYLAEDALELVEVDYEHLPAVVDPEDALSPDAPILHEAVGSNEACHREIAYGDVERAFADADVVIRERFRYPKYSSTPIETYGVIAAYDPSSGVLTITSNFMGPFILHALVARALGIAENRLRFVTPPDIGGSFGIKTSIFPYLALIGLAAMRTGMTVRWIEDRREHLMASSSGTDRVAYRELAARNDSTIVAMRSRWYDNVGGYIRSPEPGCTFRPIGNWVGPYSFTNLAADAHVMMTNKCPTGPNRGYACGHLYFEIERMVDLLAEHLRMDAAEVRRRNFIRADQFPYRTPSGGIYDSGNYAAAFDRALKAAEYDRLREEQNRARAAGRLYGVGLAVAVDPSVSNMGYVTIALDPKRRARHGYLAKSGAIESATVRIDPLGKVTAILGTAPQGQGHRTVVAQVVADELGVAPGDITVVDEMDTFTRVWGISSGTYSSRFGSVGTSAAALASRKLKDKLVVLASALIEAPAENLTFADGRIVVRGDSERGLTLKELAGQAHWNTRALPPGMEPALEATAVFGFPLADSPDEQDRVNSSNTYGFIAEVMAVEVDRETAEIRIVRYVTVHDAGVIINPAIAEGQIVGGALHGLGGALWEELFYDGEGQFLSGSFMDYLVPSASEAPAIEVAHLATPSPFTTLGAKGLGEASSMTAPAVVANAVSDALAPLGVRINELPITPSGLWHLLDRAERQRR
jgi:2-furoyl-CoA dehydrogenase large subunit